MRITKAEFKNFKRFTDLTLANIPASARLVLLIGANGSGKSSIFDGFLSFRGLDAHQEYYSKTPDKCTIEVTCDDGSVLSKYRNTDGGLFYSGPNNPPDLRFIGRSSIRIVPRIGRTSNTDQIVSDADRPRTFIDPDVRFESDVIAYMQIIDDALRIPFFRGGESADNKVIFRDFIEPLNKSLENIFGDNNSTTLRIVNYHNATPFSEPQLIFRKGVSNITYDLLSHGEKQVVVLLLNFIVRKSQYENAIIFIDEMDCHLNTSLQYRLLDEIVTRWIPESSQLWTASHALGFIDYARKSREAAILDLDNLNFDVPQYIEPESKETVDVYEIAVPRAIIFDMLKGKKIVLCENQNDEYYNLMQLPDTIFVGVKDARDLFLKAKRDDRYYSLRDRDFLSDAEIARLAKEYPHYRILRYYDFENYLYHPSNIAGLNIDGFDEVAYRDDILKQKNERLNHILVTVGTSRQGYEEFKTNEKLKDTELDDIIEDFASNDFERFYKYFDMKTQYKKTLIARLNLNKKDLVTTNWFRNSIAHILA